MDEVATLLANLHTVPDGLVCFFASHAALDAFHARISSTGLLQKLESRKRVFREPQGAAATDAVLQSYQSWIDRREELRGKPGGQGAIILCVVGGRLSEGINFSDAYGRGVVVVGLPFPNLASPDLKLKMQHLDSCAPGSTPSQAYYENLCMRAVNQSIGRAIRHAKDYAVMILVDARYGQLPGRKSYAPMLPDWIKPSIVHCNHFGQLAPQIPRFFKSMREPTNP